MPGCNTQGDTLDEAIANAREAIEGYLETLKELGRPIPEERVQPQCIVIEVDRSDELGSCDKPSKARKL